MWRITLLFSLFLLLVGCSSKANFYRLAPTLHETPNKTRPLSGKIVAVAEVSLPDYLDKPQLVMRLSETKYALLETERWIGALDRNIQQNITEKLQESLPSYTFLMEPWNEPISARYRLYVHIDRFETDAKGRGVLSGRWSLVDVDKNRFVKGRRFLYVSKDNVSETHSERIARLSRLLDRLNENIAKALRTVLSDR